MNDHNIELIEIISDKKDLLNHLPSWFIPKEFGGIIPYFSLPRNLSEL